MFYQPQALSFPGDAVPIEVRQHVSSLLAELRDQGIPVEEIQARIDAEYPCLGIKVNTQYGFTIEVQDEHVQDR